MILEMSVPPADNVKNQPIDLSAFDHDILVVCPRCGGCSHLLAVTGGRRFICSSCACNYSWDLKRDGSLAMPTGGPHLPGFELDLWLLTSCCGENLWAYNQRHIEFLESFISALLRPHVKHPQYGWSNQSLQSRLPQWMQAKHNRNEVVHGLQKLKSLLPPATCSQLSSTNKEL